jgi:C1A family cysteine protease
MESIPYHLSTIYKNAKPKFMRRRIDVVPSKLMSGSHHETDIIMIPPLNTNIFIKSIIDQHTKQNKLRLKSPSSLDDIPEEYTNSFDWRIQHRKDQSDDVSNNITRVGNQYSCGCCWAFSTSDAISDTFIQSGGLKTNPRCSVTYILSCYPHCSNSYSCYDPNASYQCGGGMIAPTLLWIAENGVGNRECIDYDWCENSASCKRGGDTDVLNSLIPPCPKNCNKYFITGVQSVALNQREHDETKIKNQRENIKKWIYNKGTILTGFFVYENLMYGTFSSDKNQKGVYFEDVDYSSNTLFNTPNANKFAGGHAVCVLGWGIGKVHNSLISDTSLHSKTNEYTDVPYWIVRNSWSEQWGDNGYFHMAMYPFNKISQFDCYVSISSDQGSGQAGGFVIFEPSNSPQKITSKPRRNILTMTTTSNNGNITLKIILVFLIFLVLCVYLYKKN